MITEHVMVNGRVAAVLPEHEMDLATLVVANLYQLARYANEVTDTVNLFHALGETYHSQVTFGWKFIPPKQAIVALYNYRMTMDSIVSATTRRSNHLKDFVDTARMEQAKQAFRTLHPHTKELRQSILHQAEMAENVERVRQTELRRAQQCGGITFGIGDGKIGPAAQSNLTPEGLQMTFQGKIYAQPMGFDMAHALSRNAVEFVECFSELGARANMWPLR